MPISVLANIDVDDLERATKFYCEGLGLTVGRRLGQSVVELRGGNSTIYLLENESGSAPVRGAVMVREYSRHWTPVHLDFVVPSLETAVERAVAAGAHLESDMRSSTWGRIASLADPFGNGFCLIEFVGRGYDEVAS